MTKIEKNETWFDIKRAVGAAVVFITLAAISPGLVDRFWPASYWIEMRAVHVDDAKRGQSAKMEEDRIIHRDFRGAYIVEVELKRLTPHIGYRLICRAEGGPFKYSVDNVGPDNLADWVDSSCYKAGDSKTLIDVKNLPAGIYRVETCRTIYPARIFSQRSVCVTSNDYTISDPPS